MLLIFSFSKLLSAQGGLGVRAQRPAWETAKQQGLARQAFCFTHDPTPVGTGRTQD